MSNENRECVPRLLVVEDDRLVADGLCRNLELEGFETRAVGTGEDALSTLAGDATGFDLVILDIMLPGIDGLEVCRNLRSQGNDIPVLFLTARGSDADRVLGLRTGADDYLTKPFLVEELVLRVRGILRRSAWSRSTSRVGPEIAFGANRVNLETMQAHTNTQTLALTEREAMLIRFFAENEGRVVNRGELLEQVWGYTFDTATRTLDTFVHRLRRYFEDDPHRPRHFHTVRGVGYRFTASAED
ncbi:MAG: response regulator transcription factor [Acidobacteria bacterium]|nr:response regulator transcription factor [Acidobacteriota bacterium]